MATQPTPKPPEATTTTFERNYKYFSAETFDLVTETVSYTFAPPTDLNDAMARIGNDQGVILKALTSYLSRAAAREAKKAVVAKGLPKSAVLNVLRPFRAMPPWSQIEDRAKQTAELLKMLRAAPSIVEAIKASAALSQASDEDDDDSGDDES